MKTSSRGFISRLGNSPNKQQVIDNQTKTTAVMVNVADLEAIAYAAEKLNYYMTP